MNLNLLPDSPCRERYIKLIQLWVEKTQTTLTQKSILLCHQLLGAEEKKISQQLDPDVVFSAAMARKLLFSALFRPQGSSFLWANLQQEQTPLAVRAASGELSVAGEGSDPTLATQDAPEATPGSPLARVKRAAKRQAAKKTPWPAAAVEAIWQAYPRKVGKGSGVPAIHKALSVIAGDPTITEEPTAFLLGRVQLYAQARAGQDAQFTPHCSTWMNQLRFADDPAEWTNAPRDRTGGIERVIEDEPIEPGPAISNMDVFNL